MPVKHEDRKEYRAKYIREHYQKNKEYYLKKANARKLKIQLFVRKHKEKPCADCNHEYPYYVMQFDHLEGFVKLFDLGKAHIKGYSEKKILEEIAKCDVVCANCHAARTFKRYGSLV